MKSLELKDKIAIITGGTKGIGLAIAENLISEGSKIVITSRTQNEIDTAVNQLRGKGEIIGIKCDVTSPMEVKNLVASTVKRFERIDILINNAGRAYIGPLSDMSFEDWTSIITTNLTSVFLCCKEVIPFMAKQNSGYIINIASNSGKTGASNFSAYCASKFGEVGFTQSLFHEISPLGIHVAALCPGAVYTDMWNNVKDDPKIKPKKEKSLTPKNVANMVAFMLKNDDMVFVEPVVLPSSLYY